MKPGRIPHSRALARVLREARDKRELSRKALGSLAGIPYSFIKIAEEIPQGTLDETRLRALMAELQLTEIPDEDPEPEYHVRWAGKTARIEVPKQVVDAIIAQRKKLRKSQRHAAFLAKMGPSSLSVFERNEFLNNTMDTDMLCRLLTVLQVERLSALGYMARKLGLRWVPRKLNAINWDEQPLGEIPDIQIAENLDVSVATVWRARSMRGFPPVPRSKWKKATGVKPLAPHDAGLLEPVPRLEDGSVDWDKVPLGQIPDAVIARWVGCGCHTVGDHRRVRKIECCRYQGRIDWCAQPLGKVADTLLAKNIGVSTAAVASARRARNISPATREDTLNWKFENEERN